MTPNRVFPLAKGVTTPPPRVDHQRLPPSHATTPRTGWATGPPTVRNIRVEAAATVVHRLLPDLPAGCYRGGCLRKQSSGRPRLLQDPAKRSRREPHVADTLRCETAAGHSLA